MTLFIWGRNGQCSLLFSLAASSGSGFPPGSHKNHLEILKFPHAQAPEIGCGTDLVMACPVIL